MAYALENARHQWLDGERRVQRAEPLEQADLERAIDGVLVELRRKLGSRFLTGELVDLYAGGTDWAEDVAQRRSAGTDTAAVVDAAFSRYAREASDWAGGRLRRPDDE